MTPVMDQLAIFLQAVGYRTVTGTPHLILYAHLLISATLPIYAGAHASLSRPSSAAKPSKMSKKRDDRDDDWEEREQTMETLGPIDALLLPLSAGLVLASLYFIIKWLEDPALLNKILNWYFAIFGVWSLARLIRDSMDIITSFVFPQSYDMGGDLWEIDAKRRKFKLTSSPSVERKSPVPGPILIPTLATKVTNPMWALWELPSRKLDVRVYIHGIVQGQFKIGSQDITSFFLATAAVLYFNLIGKPWWLTNLIGFGFAYTALQTITPSTSWAGTLILAVLFVYDIYFVFFTPIMVTVATQLDIPAKLIFPRPSRPTDNPAKQAVNILGLGDIIVPGMMIVFALRFDLYLFYLRKQTQRIITESRSTENPANVPAKEAVPSSVTKATWHPATGGWGERFWTSKKGIFRSRRFRGVLFPKTYFRASIIGYILGMLCTLGVMEIYGRSQPALLYLVPGVLGLLWGTALVKGDIKTLWDFAEGEEEEEEEAEAQSGEQKDTSRAKADHWLGVDWKGTFSIFGRGLGISDPPKSISQHDKTNEQATNGRTEKHKHIKTSKDLTKNPESSTPSPNQSTRTGPSDDEEEETKSSRAIDDNDEPNPPTGTFDRDRRSELFFLSINLAKTARVTPSNAASVPEPATSSAQFVHGTRAETAVEDDGGDGSGETG